VSNRADAQAIVATATWAVFALKLAATPAAARRDFDALDAMFTALHYPFGAFVNIGTRRRHADQYRGPFRDRMHFFAVWHADGQPHLRYAHYNDAARWAH
jgi:hypothetical protein